jgi:hypothetical protein
MLMFSVADGLSYTLAHGPQYTWETPGCTRKLPELSLGFWTNLGQRGIWGGREKWWICLPCTSKLPIFISFCHLPGTDSPLPRTPSFGALHTVCDQR